jgi:hypothetical protein
MIYEIQTSTKKGKYSSDVLIRVEMWSETIPACDPFSPSEECEEKFF